VPAVQVMVPPLGPAQSAAAVPARLSSATATAEAWVVDLPSPRASSEATIHSPCFGFQTTWKTRFIEFFRITLNT
jgi:hypothetical protein